VTTRDETRPGRLLLVASGLGLLVLLATWAPFLGRPDLLLRHFDAPNYLVVAKAFYVPTPANPLPGYILHPAYFAVHLPALPVAIRLFAPLLGYGGSLILVTALAAAFSAAAFALYARRVLPEVSTLVALLAFLLIPARHVLYRALGSTEGLMAAFVLVAVWAWHEEKYVLAFWMASLATVTRINGVLLVAVIGLFVFLKGRRLLAIAGTALSAVPLGLVFLWHWRVLGTPFAFMNVHGPKKSFVPFEPIWELVERTEWESAEMHLAVFLLLGLAAAKLWIDGLRFESTLVLAHVALLSTLREIDLPRYVLTVSPFAFVAAWREIWRAKRVALSLIAGAGMVSLVYAWRSAEQNLLTEEGWAILLRWLVA
jgi:hypothetical protein